MARLRVLLIVCLLGLAAPAFASTSGARLWTALGGRVTCGIAIHPPNTPPIRLLCSAKAVPPPEALAEVETSGVVTAAAATWENASSSPAPTTSIFHSESMPSDFPPP